ncbi:MAG: hypothetical protein HYZ23_07465 [Chloroflexi bacterium]|nr:hypothetical protein [Chloroflexota bacterium]
MTTSEYKARQVRAKTHEVIDYDRDDSKPGKPLHILIPGGMVALAALAVIIFLAYEIWLEGNLDQGLGLILIGVLSPVYIGGVFLFSYGYELYNIPRALRLTAIIVFVTLAAVVIIAVLFMALANMNGGSRSSSSSSSSSSSKGGKSSSSARSSSSSRSSSSGSSVKPSVAKGGSNLGGIAGMAGAIGNKSSSSSGSSSGGGSSKSGGGVDSGHIYVGHGGGGTRVETREVTKEVVKEVPKEPMPITCPFCTRSYIPVEHKFTCPSCGAATPRELIEESQEPKK